MYLQMLQLVNCMCLCAGRGELSVRKIRQALNKFSEEIVPLTVYQIHTIMSVAPLDHLGSVKYTQMVPIVADTVKAITSLQNMKQRFYVIQQLADSNLLKQLSETEPGTFGDQLKAAFENADTDRTGTLTGVLEVWSHDHANCELWMANIIQVCRQASFKCSARLGKLHGQQPAFGSSYLAEHACSG